MKVFVSAHMPRLDMIPVRKWLTTSLRGRRLAAVQGRPTLNGRCTSLSPVCIPACVCHHPCQVLVPHELRSYGVSLVRHYFGFVHGQVPSVEGIQLIFSNPQLHPFCQSMRMCLHSGWAPKPILARSASSLVALAVTTIKRISAV